MACYGNGIIEIPLEDLWEFIGKYSVNKEAEISYGVPRIDKLNKLFVIDYAFNTECNSFDEAGFEHSDIAKQWEVKG